MSHHVANTGGGFSGPLLAINLLRHQGPRATLIERAPEPGVGLAYGAAHPSHVLNVRAGNMSALPDDPGHFVRWLEGRGVADAASAFIPRVTYGEYLRQMLDETRRAAGDRLTVIQGEVTDLDVSETATLTLGDRTIHADAAGLGAGNL